ncbi:EAL domain-containing protein [Marinobacter sp. TBZ242]|uniref:EAL domain-containing protein n=1 Tax=Marinobacter azerbaijanicus TaxID=3050455 RepID=A0ABT7IB64_9GAMM|nr:EAL domain-containing protein [Marinobacter sp. TBZ242]MDL0431402.1 EAL domain-containing protein [Marinobacter sp. TBZ242]
MTTNRAKESDAFEIFPWNCNFETGLKDIDDQHRVLVNILNRLAWHFASSSSEEDGSHLLDELLAYASYHFEYEEGVWEKSLGASVISRNHHDSHQMFFRRIQTFRQSQAPQEDVLAELFDYLTRWLAFHILESDRRMALTVKALEAGKPLKEAREYVESELSGSVSVLVAALLEIYGKLSDSTIQLMREKMARQKAEDELHRLQNERLHQALEAQASDHQKQVEFLAYSDALTGLWNRNGITRFIRELLDRGDLEEDSAALVSIDLDNFYEINSRFGEETADRMLGLLARRWLDALPPDAALARIGGDEFVLLLPDASQVESRLHALQLTGRLPFDLGGGSAFVSFSAGIVLFPDKGMGELAEDADTLLRQADNTLFRAKHELKGSWLFLDVEEKKANRSRQLLLSDIRKGLENGEFRLFYQPKVNLRNGEVKGVEALIRWEHPDKGLLSPAAFLPAIEYHPLMIELGEWVLFEALTQMKAWDKQGIYLNIGVNIAAIQLLAPEFAERLQDILAGFPEQDPRRLDLEILETATLGELERAVSIIVDCKRLGVTFSLDDFGTGYSSLSYLKQLPVNTLKIDREFVSGAGDTEENLSILRGIIGLSKAFDRELIAEGVETVEQGEVLLSLGCDFAQGYGISPPIAADRLADWFADWKPFPQWTVTSTLSQ